MAQDRIITFRLDRQLATAAAEKARREQVPLSQVMRAALERQVQRAD